MKELRIYSIPQSENNSNITDIEFIELAEEAGTVYSLTGFLSNLKEVNTAEEHRAYLVNTSSYEYTEDDIKRITEPLFL